MKTTQSPGVTKAERPAGCGLRNTLWLEALAGSRLGDNEVKCGYDAGSNPGTAIKTINLKREMPTVAEALQHLDRELPAAAREPRLSS